MRFACVLLTGMDPCDSYGTIRLRMLRERCGEGMEGHRECMRIVYALREAGMMEVDYGRLLVLPSYVERDRHVG